MDITPEQLAEIASVKPEVANYVLHDECKGNCESALQTLMKRHTTPYVIALASTTAQAEYLAAQLAAYNIELTNINYWTVKEYAAPEKFDEFLETKVRVLGIDHVVCFVTMGDGFIPLQDYCNQVYGIVWNDYARSDDRRHKYKMQELLKKAGVPCPTSVEITTLDEAKTAIARDFEGRFPVIVKPSTGAGTEYCFKANDMDELEQAVSVSLGQDTTQITTVMAITLQQYLTGTEYVVDAVSCRSNHLFTDVWTSYKVEDRGAVVVQESAEGKRLREQREKEEDEEDPEAAARRQKDALTNKLDERIREESAETEPTGGKKRKVAETFLYDRQEFIQTCDPRIDPDAHRVAEYTARCLDAVGVVQGASHCEVMLTPDHGPLLIEVNARMQGDTPRSTELVGYDQISLMALLFVQMWNENPKNPDFGKAKGEASGTSSSTGEGEGGPLPPPKWPNGYPRHYSSAAVAAKLKEWRCEAPIATTSAAAANVARGTALSSEQVDQIRSSLPLPSRWVVFLNVGYLSIVSEKAKRYIREQLPCYSAFTRCSVAKQPENGSLFRVAKTMNLHSCPGAVLINGTAPQLKKSWELLVQMQRPGYRMEPIKLAVDDMNASRVDILSQQLNDLVEQAEREQQEQQEGGGGGGGDGSGGAELTQQRGIDGDGSGDSAPPPVPDTKLSQLNAGIQALLTEIATFDQKYPWQMEAMRQLGLRHDPPPLFIPMEVFTFLRSHGQVGEIC